VRWRSGVTEDFALVPAGSRLVLKEGSGKAEPRFAFVAPRVRAPSPFPSKLSDLPVTAGEGLTVVQLFMQSCKPCRAEVPALNALAKKGVKVVGLGLHTEEELPRVKKAMKIAYEVHALPESVAAAFDSPQGLTLPTVLIYGQDGALVRVLAGGEQVGAVLGELARP
jgi:thiol-disulfide isomerase/thioredoxin